MTSTTDISTTERNAEIDAALENIRTVADAQALFASYGFDVADDEKDNIRSLPVVDKESLINVPFLALRWRFNESKEYGGVFVSIECMTQDGSVVVVNDGSTGLAAQFQELSEHRTESGHPSPFAGRMVRRGLSRSDYQTEGPKGDLISASTFYAQW